MARNVMRTADFYDKEILRGADGLVDVKSMVVDSAELVAESNGRIVLQPGEVMGKISGSSKIMPVRMGDHGTGGAGAWVAADIVGINETFYEFPTGVTLGAATDHEVAVIFKNARFNASKLLGYSGRETVVKAGLPTCQFE